MNHIPKPTTILLAILTATGAAAQPAINHCIDEDGRVLLTDRAPNATCRRVEIRPYPVNDRPETHYGVITVTDINPTYGY